MRHQVGVSSWTTLRSRRWLQVALELPSVVCKSVSGQEAGERTIRFLPESFACCWLWGGKPGRISSSSTVRACDGCGGLA